MRVERIVESAELWSQIVEVLPVEAMRMAAFTAEIVFEMETIQVPRTIVENVDGEDVETTVFDDVQRATDVVLGYRVGMEEAAVAAVDAILDDIPGLLKRNLIAHAERRRWEIEVGGILIGDIAIATDEESQRKILGAYVAATRNPAWSTFWESVHPIDAETMIAIGDAVQNHINASFVTRGSVFAAIEAGTITTTTEIDAAFAS